MIQILDLVTCGGTITIDEIVPNVVSSVVTIIKIIIPIFLIIFGMLDLGKAVIAGKEDEMKKAQSTLIKRIIYAVAVFLVVTLVTFVMGLVGSKDWKDCWKNHGRMNTQGVETDPESGAA